MNVNIALPPPGPCGWGQVGLHVRDELQALGYHPREVSARDVRLDGPLLQALQGPKMAPTVPFAKPSAGNFGYCFFEAPEIVARDPQRLEKYDHIFCGSRWNEDALRGMGYDRCNTVLQGIDERIFTPGVKRFDELRDAFVVFSGGKFELRKGQDVVLLVFHEFAKRHEDAHLVTLWWNPWPNSEQTMEQSQIVDYSYIRGQASLIADLALTDRVHQIKADLVPQQVADVMRASDVALFPNRAEGGTNLVLMEAMACGLPCLVTAKTGQADVCGTWCMALSGGANAHVNGLGDWWEPDPAEFLDALEWAYANREAAKALGAAAAEKAREWTWRATTEAFLRGMGVSDAH